MSVIDLKNATIKVQDLNGLELEITVGEGNLNYTERRNIDYILDKGNLDDVREGDQVPVEVSLALTWEFYKGKGSSTDGTPTPIDCFKQNGNAAHWVSTDSDSCRPYAVDVVVDYDPACGTDGLREIITFTDFRYEEIAGDMRAGTFSINGKCNVTAPSVIRMDAGSNTF